MASRLSRFFGELKRRRVYHVAVVYLAIGGGMVYNVPDLFATFDLSQSAARLVIILIALGFPIALVLAWAYEVRPESQAENVSAETPGPVLGASGSTKPDAAQRNEEGVVDLAEGSGGDPRGTEYDDPRIPGQWTRPTIAVLPFGDFSPNPDDAYFAGGMHEEILTQLQKVGGLAVRARTSVLRYRDDPKPVPEIARELGVQYLVEGSARKAGGQVRLTAQLMDAAKDEHIWADNYDRPLTMENLIAVQAEIATQVAMELKAVISPEGEDLSVDRPTDSLEAYQEYLRGRHFIQRYTKGGFTKGIEHFQRAISLDDRFAVAYVGLGYCYKEMSDLSYMDPAEGYGRAQTALTKSLELDDSSGEAHAILASKRFLADWDMKGPEESFLKAVELSPDVAEVFLLFGSYLMWLGREAESIEMLGRGVELDPLSPLMNTWFACAYFYANRYEESIRVHQRLLELEPNSLWSNIYLSHNYSALGDHERALEYAEAAEAIGRAMGDDYVLVYVGGSFAWAGEEKKARDLLDLAMDLHGKGTMDAVSVAVIFSQLGEKENAFQWLGRAIDEHAGLAVWLKIYGKTFLGDLRGDPRFDQLLRRVGFPA